jgi:hypothetical protein
MYERDDQADTRTSPGMRRHAEPDFGFAIDIPRRFIELANTVDHVAQMMRGGNAGPGSDDGTGWPAGLCDPEVLGVLEGGRVQPLRLLEIDTRRRAGPLSDEQAAAVWFEAREVLPGALASTGLPGYRLLDVRDSQLGSLGALAFEWRWDGMTSDDLGGDRALLVWALLPDRVFHVYYHCCGAQWEARTPELLSILASFEVLS